MHYATRSRYLVYDALLFLIIFAFSTHAAIEYTIFYFKVNGHCFLFGQIFEKDRKFVNGNPFVCWFVFLAQYWHALTGLYYAWCTWKDPSLNWLVGIKRQRYTFCCIIGSFAASLLFSAGFYSICNSLEYAPVCNAETIWNLEFKYFQPKYLDANRFFGQFLRITISSWSCSFCWLLAIIMNIRKAKT